MYIAKFTLITLVTFVFLMGCGMVGQQAEMPEETTMAAEEKPMDELAVPTPEKAAYQEVTLQVEGMTWGACPAAVQDALSKVTGVTEVVSVDRSTKKAVVKVEKGKVKNDALIKAVEADPRFTASVVN